MKGLWFGKETGSTPPEELCRQAEQILNGKENSRPAQKRKAVSLLKRSAAAGCPEAEFALGLCYSTGNGVAPDYREAARWFEKAARRGDVDAQVNLALLYAGPCNCAAHREKAVYWLTQAARQGDAQAAACLAELTRDPSPFQ